MLFAHICDSLWQLAMRSYFYFIHLSLSALFIDIHSLLPIFREREKPLLPAPRHPISMPQIQTIQNHFQFVITKICSSILYLFRAIDSNRLIQLIASNYTAIKSDNQMRNCQELLPNTIRRQHILRNVSYFGSTSIGGFVSDQIRYKVNIFMQNMSEHRLASHILCM